MLYRALMLYANLIQVGRSVQASPAFIGLDPSEKGAVSYFFGLTMAKLFSERLLNVPWLMHLDVYETYLRPRLVAKKRPDLVGKDNSGRWVIVEAKGRSNSLGPNVMNNVMNKAKQQTRELRTIRGCRPYLRAAFACYFSRRQLKAEIQDPDDLSENGPDLRIEDAAFLSDYYRPIIDIFSNSDAKRLTFQDGRLFRVVEFRGIDMQIGLNEQLMVPAKSGEIDLHLMKSLSESKLSWPPIDAETGHVRLDVHSPLKNPSDLISQVTVGGDGTIVTLGPSWSEQEMSQVPQQRKLLFTP